VQAEAMTHAERSRLIQTLAEEEPAFFSLGTPVLVDGDATRALVADGRDAVPQLIRALEADDPKVAMYAAYCLGQIGDPSAAPHLRSLSSRYAAKEPASEYDTGVASVATAAADRLVGEG
jgi:HEAT repeat protein